MIIGDLALAVTISTEIKMAAADRRNGILSGKFTNILSGGQTFTVKSYGVIIIYRPAALYSRTLESWTRLPVYSGVDTAQFVSPV